MKIEAGQVWYEKDARCRSVKVTVVAVDGNLVYVDRPSLRAGGSPRRSRVSLTRFPKAFTQEPPTP